MKLLLLLLLLVDWLVGYMKKMIEYDSFPGIALL